MSKFFAIALALIVALSGVAHAQTSGSDSQVIENASALADTASTTHGYSRSRLKRSAWHFRE